VTSNKSRAQPSLARSISTSLGKVALVIVTIQSIVVVGINYFDYHNLYLAHVELETQALLEGIKTESGQLHFTLPHGASRYNGKHQDAYGFRVLDATGRVIAANGPALLEAVSPWRQGSAVATDFWFMKLDGSRPFYFAGGRKLRVDDHDVLIEIVTLGDPGSTRWWLTLSEAVEDVWLPIAPLLILIPIMTTIAVRRGLRPLVRAAQQAEAIHLGHPKQRLDLADMPRETVAFASAINGLIERVGNLVQSQKIFIASAAHELRTPLTIMLLELEKIDHPRARRLNADVTGMTSSVNRLLVLARLEAAQPPALVDVDLGELAKETIDRLQSWAVAQGHKIELCLGEPQKLRGDPVAIGEALRNLVENAVKHTPAGTSIRLTVGPETTVTVEDSGPGLAVEITDQLFEPFRKGNASAEGAGLGLAIIRQAVALHRGSIQVGRSSLGGAMFKLRFA
jgi:two-component system, OmpR family, sensor histidine kinase QseC